MASSNGWFLTSAIKRVFEKLHTQSAILPTRSSRMPLRRKPLFEGLEGRLLLSADPVGLTVPLDPVDPAPSAVTESVTDTSAAARDGSGGVWYPTCCRARLLRSG